VWAAVHSSWGFGDGSPNDVRLIGFSSDVDLDRFLPSANQRHFHSSLVEQLICFWIDVHHLHLCGMSFWTFDRSWSRAEPADSSRPPCARA
jgi:hypothetical protein